MSCFFPGKVLECHLLWFNEVIERKSSEVIIMAKCAVCGKGVTFGNNVSHSHRRSNRMIKANIQSVKCNVNGTPTKLHVCTRCLRSGAVERV